VLVALVGELPRPAAERVEETLYLLAGDDVPAASEDEDADKRRAAWESWWAGHGRTLDLRRGDRPTRSLGYTLVAQLNLQGDGEVVETDATGRVRWHLEGLQHPIDSQLLGNDRLLVADYSSRTVSERNLKGEILWHKTVPDLLLGARRLSGGSTFVVTRGRVFEVDAEGREWRAVERAPADVAAACRLRDGQTVLVTTNGQCLRLDAEGREVKSFRVGVVMSVGSHIDVSPGGHVFVPLSSRNQVVEYDGEGKLVWSASVARPSAVQRLPNGHLLVSSRQARTVVEIDRRGEEVWAQPCTGHPLRALRR
jgi:outer membrane protein assembly factor BamB